MHHPQPKLIHVHVIVLHKIYDLFKNYHYDVVMAENNFPQLKNYG